MGFMHALCIKYYDNIEMEGDEHARIMKDHCAQDFAALFRRNYRKNISLDMTCSAYGLPMTKGATVYVPGHDRECS